MGLRERNSPQKGRIGILILNALGKEAVGGIQEILTFPKVLLPTIGRRDFPPNQGDQNERRGAKGPGTGENTTLLVT